jgi:hypothetical protein
MASTPNSQRGKQNQPSLQIVADLLSQRKFWAVNRWQFVSDDTTSRLWYRSASSGSIAKQVSGRGAAQAARLPQTPDGLRRSAKQNESVIPRSILRKSRSPIHHIIASALQSTELTGYPGPS